MSRFVVAALVLLALILPAAPRAGAEEAFTVTTTRVRDQKAVFATVESANVVPARARIGGIVVDLAVKEGDRVEQGQVLATVGDEKLVLQLNSLDAQISGLEAQLAQARTDLTRAERLFEQGTVPKKRLEDARTAVSVAENALRARKAERSVIAQQLDEGKVEAPASGLVLEAPVISGSVVLAGETVASIAERGFVLRLRVPERHARFIKLGDTVRIDGADIGLEGPRFGKVKLIYPRIEEGRVVADADVEGLGDYYVGERIRVWISVSERSAIIVPAEFITTRFGVDYVHLRKAGGVVEVPVQRGRELPRPEMPRGIEILSGLRPGDELVRP